MTRICKTLPPAYAFSSLSVLALAAVLPVTAAQAQDLPPATVEQDLDIQAPAAQDGPTGGQTVRITPTASISEEWTDNVGGVTTTRDGRQEREKESDFITTLNAGVGVVVQGARTDLNARYNLGYDYYLSRDELNGLRHNLAGTGTYEAIEDHLFLDASTALSQRSVGIGPRTATERTTGADQTLLWTYALGPTWRQRLSDFADASAAYRLSGTTFFEADVGDVGENNRPSDSIGHELIGNLVAGERFGRLRWDIGTLIGNYYNGGDLREERRTVDLGAEYRISPEVGLLASTGYDDIQFHETEGVNRERADQDDVSAPFWTVGVRYNPSPNLDTRVEAGRRFDEPYYTGAIGWDITSRSNLSASYTIDVVTQQQALIEAQCADPTDPFCLPLEEDLTNDSFTRKILSVRFTHEQERTTYGLSGAWSVREFSGSEGGDDSTLSFVASADHRLTPDTSGFLQIGYTLGDSTGTGRRTFIGAGDEDSGDVQSLRGTVGLSQQLTDNLAGSLSYSHLRREDGDSEVSTENSIVARVSASF